MINSEISIFIVTIINGIIIGILFDFFRVLRRVFKTGIIITSIEDILFWILTGATILYTIFKFNNGIIRGYIFMGIFIGIMFYILTLSRFFIKVNVTILKFIDKIIIEIIKPLTIPFKIIINSIIYIFTKLHKISGKLVKKKKEIRRNFRKSVEI